MIDIPAPAPAKLTAEEITERLWDDMPIPPQLNTVAEDCKQMIADTIREQARAHLALVDRYAEAIEYIGLLRARAILRADDAEAAAISEFITSALAAPPAAAAKETGP